MLKGVSFLWGLVALVGLSACRKPAPPAPSMDIATFCGDGKKPAIEKGQGKGERGQVEGYLQMPSMFVMCSDTCLFQLSSDKEGKGPKVGLSLKIGSGESRIDRPGKNFSKDSLTIRTTDEKKVDLSRPLRASGARIGSDAKSCVMIVDRIEQ